MRTLVFRLWSFSRSVWRSIWRSVLRLFWPSLWFSLLLLFAARSASTAAPGSSRAHDDVGNAADDESDDELINGPRVPVLGPSIARVLSAAYAAAGLDRDPVASWTWRARLAGLAPWLTVRTARDTSWQDEHAEIGRGTSLEVRATWRLDRLVFDGHELQAAATSATRQRERRRLATRVIRLYFAWRRAARLVADPDDDRRAARIAEPAAELDALTEGWFSEELARLHPRTREARSRDAPAGHGGAP